MKIKTVSMIGLGAVGCAVAPELIRLLPRESLRIVAGGARKARLERQGVVVNGEHYDCFVTDPETDCGPADLVIVSVKYHALPQAIADLKHHVGEHTILLSLMNGVNSRQIIGQTYGIEKCLYGICNLSTVNHGNGVFTVSHMKGGISIGEARNAPPYSERLQAVASLFDEAGIDYQIPQDMVHAQWWKFLLNVGGNCTNTVLRGTQSYFQVLEPANRARRMVMEEVLKVGQAEGVNITQNDVEELMGVYKNYPAGNTCSMLQDLLKGARTENDMFCGYVVELGKKHGIATPVNEYLYHLIDALDEVNAGAPVVRVDV